MDVTQCKNKISELFRTGDKTNIELGMILAESQDIDLQELCKDYIELKEVFGLDGVILEEIVFDISNCIYLNTTRMVGSLKSINLCTSVENMNLSHSNLKKLPDEIKDLKNLEHLHLEYNEFQIIPEVIFEIPNLKYIDLRCCELSARDAIYARKILKKRNIICNI